MGGQAKGRKLYGPSGRKFRPTTGIVKEFIYSYLQTMVKDAVILDLFSGSGALGIEAISRGASKVIFIERSLYSLKIIERNLNLCRFSGNAAVLKGNVFSQLRRLGKKGGQYDLILADPPFNDYLRQKIVTAIDAYNLITNDGLLLVEHLRGDSDDMGHSLNMIKQRRFGNRIVSIYRKEV